MSISAFLNAVVVSFAVSAANGDGITLQDVLLSLGDNLGQLNAVEVTTRTTINTTEKGRAALVKDEEARGADERMIKSLMSTPLEMTTATRYMTDGVRFREESFDGAENADPRRQQPTKIAVFNGKTLKTYTSSNQTGLIASLNPDDPRHPRNQSSLFAYRLRCDRFFEGVPKDKLDVKGVNGVFVFELLAPTPKLEYEQAGIQFQVEIDPDHGGLVRSLTRTQVFVKKDGTRELGQKFYALNVELAEQGGVFYPTRMTEEVYLPDPDDKQGPKVLHQKNVIETLEVDSAPTLVPGLFDLQFPPNTRVYDSTLGDVITVGDEAELLKEAEKTLALEMQTSPAFTSSSVLSPASATQPTQVPVVRSNARYYAQVAGFIAGVVASAVLAYLLYIIMRQRWRGADVPRGTDVPKN